MNDDAQPGMHALVAFLCVVALVATPLLALGEAIRSSCFMSCGVPAGTPQDEGTGVSMAFILGTVVSVIGIALSTYTGQRTARLLFGLVLVLTLFIGLTTSIDDIREQQPVPRPPAGTGCQEHSGGDTTCPGG
jgi:hypothetical protein